MTAFGPSTRPCVALAAVFVAALALTACGPRIEAGDESFVHIKSGPFTTFGETQRVAREYCAQYGKEASVQGSNPDPATLQDAYRFDCVPPLD